MNPKPKTLSHSAETAKLRLDVHNSLTEFSAEQAAQWDALVQDNNPFLKHGFLSALEAHGCVGEHFGWLPHHLTLTHESPDGDHIVAALPLYEKHNNYGEFVFDQAWEQAWNHVGLPYYPKLVSAVPYTPAQGQRFLIHPQPETISYGLFNAEQLQTLLFDGALALAEELNMSGVHWLFANPEQQAWLESHKRGYKRDNEYFRHDCQFHWFNQEYQTFDDFLAQLKKKKRKNIRQERKAVAESAIQFRQLNGHTTTEDDWDNFSYFYQKTFIDKWSTPTLNLDFFKAIAQAIPEQVLLVLADLDGRCIAGALMFRSDTTLYGRHWGCIEEVKHLHFETCFYQGIDYAIENNIQTFEPGAGGEHKIARGFTPVKMRSTHWLTQNPFPAGLARFIEEEKHMIDDYAADCWAHSPYNE
ncbi:MAG: GNAT family N-acetyltransferase [Hydrogenovibrio sp.]